MIGNPITKNAGDSFFGNQEPVAFDFNDNPLFLGDTYYICLGYLYKKEDTSEFFEYLVDALGEDLLGELNAKQVNREDEE